MRNLIPSYIRVPVIFFIIFGLVEYFVDSGAQPAFIEFPIVLLFLILVLIILIAIEAIVGALENVMFQSLSQEEKERFLDSKNKTPEFAWIKKTYLSSGDHDSDLLNGLGEFFRFHGSIVV